MLPLLYAPLAFAQATVVAVGDSPSASVADDAAPVRDVGAKARTLPGAGVAALEGGSPRGTVPSGWVAVLADCLEERAPKAWTVVDRAALGDTPRAVRERLASLRELGPEVVVLGVGAREVARADGQVAPFREEVERIVTEIRQARPAPGVLLLGLVPPTVSQLPASAEVEQASLDDRARGYNAALRDLARADGVHHLDLQGDWPVDPPARSALTVDGWRLTDQGHARVAATVCDAILSHYGAAMRAAP